MDGPFIERFLSKFEHGIAWSCSQIATHYQSATHFLWLNITQDREGTYAKIANSEICLSTDATMFCFFLHIDQSWETSVAEEGWSWVS